MPNSRNRSSGRAVQAGMVRFCLVLAATVVLTSACPFHGDKPYPPPRVQRYNATAVAYEFSRVVYRRDSKAAWKLLNPKARRHYRQETAFLPRLGRDPGTPSPGLGTLGPGVDWMTIGQLPPSGKRPQTHLLLPADASPARVVVGRAAVPIDSGPDITSPYNRIGVPEAANMTIRTPAPGATVRAPRPAFTLVVPEASPVTVTLASAPSYTVVPAGQRTLAAQAVRARGRTADGGHAYTWRPDFDLRPGRYVFAASAGHDGRWSWNALPITVGP
jgi:hypothetical protein